MKENVFRFSLEVKVIQNSLLYIIVIVCLKKRKNKNLFIITTIESRDKKTGF